jgi:hypothetical protein
MVSIVHEPTGRTGDAPAPTAPVPPRPDPALRARLAERESYAYGAASGLIRRTWKCQRDRPEKAIRTIVATLQRWCSSCDWIATGGAPPEPAVGEVYRVRLTPKGLAALAAARAAGAAR